MSMSILLRYRLVLLAVSLLVGSCLTSSQILADQVGLTVDVLAEACIPALAQCTDNQFSQILVSSVIVPTQTSTLGSGFGTASGTVDFGLITGNVSAAGDFSQIVGASNGEGSFTGVWQDSLIVTSNTLAPGTPVDLQFTLTVHAALGCSGMGSAVSAIASLTGGNDSASFVSQTCNTSLNGTQMFTVATTVGADLPVEGQLAIVAGASGFNPDFSASTAAVDPPSSVFYIDSLTPGASYTTGSGNTYFTPITSTPEPSSLLMLGSCLLGLLGLLVGKRNT